MLNMGEEVFFDLNLFVTIFCVCSGVRGGGHMHVSELLCGDIEQPYRVNSLLPHYLGSPD